MARLLPILEQRLGQEGLTQTYIDERRQINALKAMQELARRSPQLQAQYFPHVARIATSGLATSGMEAKLAETMGQWMPPGTPDAALRAAVRARAPAAPPRALPVWCTLLERFGGRQEILVRLQLVQSRKQLNGQTYPFQDLRWPGMLPYLKQSLDDPLLAPSALTHTVLSGSDEGRKVLLDFCLDKSRPLELRQRAVGQLGHTVAGVELLIDATRDRAAEHRLSGVLGTHPRSTPEAELAYLNELYHDSGWRQLIYQLDPSYWSEDSIGIDGVYPEAVRKKLADSALRVLQFLAGRSDLAGREQWSAWFETERPCVFPREQLLRFIRDHPETIHHTKGFLSIASSRLGRIAPECLPLYQEMVRHPNPELRLWACGELLKYTDDPDAVSAAIELIGEAAYGNSIRAWTAAAILRQRFAVEYPLDATAWRKWWAEYKAQGD